MEKVKIALVRFYNAKFLQLDQTDRIVWEQNIDDLKIVCQLCEETTYSKMGGINGQITDKIDVGRKAEKVMYPETGRNPVGLIFEVIAYKEIDLEGDLVANLKSGDLEARGMVFKEFDKYESKMQEGIDYTAGMIGLRISSELVRIPVYDNDHRYLFIDKERYAIEVGLSVEVKNPVTLSHKDGYRIVFKNDKLKGIKKDKFQEAGECLSWFLRGWATSDQVLKFVCFFTALESIVPRTNKKDTEDFKKCKNHLSNLVKSDNEASASEELSKFLDQLIPFVSIAKRFERMATEAGLHNWVQDIEEFKKFNKIRNLLLHEGDWSIAKKPFVKNEDLMRLEKLSEKYVGYILFGRRNHTPINESQKTTLRMQAGFNDLLQEL